MTTDDLRTRAEEAAWAAADDAYPESVLAPENEALADAYAAGFLAAHYRTSADVVLALIRGAEVERLREYIDRMPYPSDMDELRADRDRLAATVERVRAVADRMAEREWALTPAATWRDALRAALNEGDET